ncbi:hypothetical protein Q7C36_003887 [Tachysurus vachellii]|uniref:Serine/threonine-protein kinase n=1 Tax=Tachysurus vachellii TaxID=175792 RepID=A0AA88T6B5_TACVA|nr:serine/threonine-protein kinase pim-1-like [Tachysurus vachellii]KAK2864733.1 hypothetical protein Q7C36_003887 [Tachysurus vachellii]
MNMIPNTNPHPPLLSVNQEWTEVIASQYTASELLGQGNFSYVYAGVRNVDWKQVAIKCVAKTVYSKNITIPGGTQTLPLEVALMQMLSVPPRSRNVVELLEWFDLSDWVVLVLERPSPCSDLQEFCICNNGLLSESLVRNIMWQVVQAARHCCNNGVFHRDIRPENILINTDTMVVKLIDFGNGDLLKDSPYRTFAGTPPYCPPEWLHEGKYLGRPSTVWNLGVLLFYLVCGHVPFMNSDQIINGIIPICHHVSKECSDLISLCLKKDPRSRPTFEDIIRHKWFTMQL